MDEQLAAFLEQKHREAEEAKRREHREAEAAKQRERAQLLTRLGLVNVTREYAPDNVTTAYEAGVMGYTKFENIQQEGGAGKRRFFKETRIPIEITDEEYQQLLDALGPQVQQTPQEKHGLASQSQIQPHPAAKSAGECFSVLPGAGAPSMAARFYRIMAVLVWIIGVIAAFALSGQSNPYTRETSFNFGTFIAILLSFGVSGMVLFCMAELFENVKRIADSFPGMTVRSSDK